MRTPRAYRFLEHAFRAGKERNGMRLIDQQALKTMKYVLNNARKHGVRLPANTPDPFSSARWFEFWRKGFRRPLRSPPVVSAQSWWPANLLSSNERPGRRAESWTFEELLAATSAPFLS